MLGGQPRRIVGGQRPPGGDEDGEEREHVTVGRLGPAAGHCVGSHHRARFPMRPGVVCRHLGHPAGNSVERTRGRAARCGLARLTSIAIS